MGIKIQTLKFRTQHTEKTETKKLSKTV